jgi:CRP-like cAMP-binding protein
MEDPMLSLEERQALASGRWFAALSPTLRHDILRHGVLRRFRRGEPIFCRGEPASTWGAVVSGMVRVSATHRSGKPLTLCYMRPGLWFSDAALLEDGPRCYDAHAHGATAMLMLARADVLAILREHHELYGALLRLHAGRTRQMFELVQDLQTLPLRARIAKQLARMASQHGVASPRRAGEIRIGLQLAQEELASLVSASRQRVNRELQELRAQGLLRTEQCRLVVCNLPGLQAVATGQEARAAVAPLPAPPARPELPLPWQLPTRPEVRPELALA